MREIQLSGESNPNARRSRSSASLTTLAVLAASLLAATCESKQSDLVGTPPGGTDEPPQNSKPPTVTLDANDRGQTVTGWYATSQAGQYECSTFPAYQAELFDRTVNELGLNRMKLAVRAAAEHPVDHFAVYLNRPRTRESFQTWQATWFHAENDNADPYSINPAGFHWGDVDYTIESMALPMKQRLEARGERLFLSVTFTDNRRSSFDHKSAPQEYAEYMLALYQHLQSKYGLVPDLIEVVNEPDITSVSWSAKQVANAIVAAGNRLEAAGFEPRFAAPGTADMSKAITFYDEILETPGASKYITELSYHRYHRVSDEALTTLGQRAKRDGIGTNMSEHIGSGYEDLHADLTTGRASAWMQFALGLCGSRTADGGAVYYNIDEASGAGPEIIPQSRTPFLAQYFRNIRLGAQRIGAASSDANVDPVAFINPNGRFVVVAKTEGAATFSVGNLPAGRYGIGFTTNAEPNGTHPDVVLSSSGKVPATIPARGVIAIYGK